MDRVHVWSKVQIVHGCSMLFPTFPRWSLLIRILGVTGVTFRLVWMCSFASPDGQHWTTSIVSRLSGFRWSWACGLHTVFPTFSSSLDREFKMRLLDWVRQISALEVLEPYEPMPLLFAIFYHYADWYSERCSIAWLLSFCFLWCRVRILISRWRWIRSPSCSGKNLKNSLLRFSVLDVLTCFQLKQYIAILDMVWFAHWIWKNCIHSRVTPQGLHLLQFYKPQTFKAGHFVCL